MSVQLQSHTKVRAARLARGWTQVDLAYHARISLPDISRIETGRMVPYPAHAERLSELLGIPAEELQEMVPVADVNLGEAKSA